MIHTTKDGIVMLIADMDDEHLSNTIGLFCRKIKAARLHIQKPKKTDFLSSLFVDEDDIDHEAIIKKSTERLLWYIFEASIRGMIFSGMLQQAFGRETLDLSQP